MPDPPSKYAAIPPSLTSEKSVDQKLQNMIPQLIAEFIGTFLLVFTVGCNILSMNPVWTGVSVASALMVMIYAFGKISGGNFNPAVSIALGLAKAMGCKSGKTLKEVGMFSVVQIVAGVLAGFGYYALFGKQFHLAPATGFSWVSAAACELLYTFVLCFVVLNVAAVETKTKNNYYGLAIGFVVIAAAYGAGAVSGGCLNPAVAIGIDVIGGLNLGLGWSMLYTLSEILGAVLAAGLFVVVRPKEFNKNIPEIVPVLLSEFLGTFVLVLTVGLNVLGSSEAGAFSIAASLMCMIYALGDISGAHFNPAVTLAILCCNKTQKQRPFLKAKEAGLYMLAQILGGVVAGFSYVCIYQLRAFPLGPARSFGWPEVAIAEIVFTFVLCLVVLSVAVSRVTFNPDMFGLAIGSCITVGGFAIGSISGGSLNPAVSLGIASSQFWSPSVTYGALLNQLGNALIYSLFEFLGAIIAAKVLERLHKSTVDGAEPFMPTPFPIDSQLLAEFIGTFLLVFTVGCNVLGNNQKAWIGVSIASVLMVMIYALGQVSGANFNPAVSFTQGLIRSMNGRKLGGGQPLGMSWKNVGLFVGVQIIAGILAGFCYYAVFDTAFHLAPASGFSWWSAGVCELCYTFMLCFVVSNVTITDNTYFGLAIGFVIVAGAYGAGAVSGGCFNPAVAIGIDLIGGSSFGLGWSMIYIIFEAIGAVLAAILLFAVRPNYFGSPPRHFSVLVSEFLGTYMLVLTVGLNVLAKSPAGAFSIAASLMCMIYALGDVSGAHFNPAVSLAVLLCEKGNKKEYAQYMVVQILAGIAASLTYMSIYQGEGFPLGPGKGFGWTDAGIAEFVFTFLLCLVVLCVAVKSPTSGTPMFGLAIGSCITVGGFAVGKVSGASLNPAVSFGIGISQFFSFGMEKAAIYACAEMMGAVAAAGVATATHKIASHCA